MTPDAELTLAAATDITALAWALQRRVNYLAGPQPASALAAVFGPVLTLAWVYMALWRRVLAP
jgi:hypothetical protein